jgi:hypothetical protein
MNLVFLGFFSDGLSTLSAMGILLLSLGEYRGGRKNIPSSSLQLPDDFSKFQTSAFLNVTNSSSRTFLL